MRALRSRPYHVLGFGVFTASIMGRFLERWWHTLDMRELFPEIAIAGLPIWGMPIELWATPWPELALVVGVGAAVSALLFPRARSILLAFLFFFLLYTATGGAAVGKALVFLQPMLLYCFLLSLFGEFAPNRERLSPWAARMGWWFLAGMYGFNAISKVGPEWLAGTAFADFTTSNVWGPGWFVTAPTGLGWSLLTYFTMAWEFAGFLLVFPWPRFRTVYGVMAILFHGILAYMTPFKVLGLAIAGIWLLLWGNRSEIVANEREASRWQRPVFFAWATWIVVCNLGHLHLPEAPQLVRHTFSRVALWPSWRLFAPSPAKGQLHLTLERPGHAPFAVSESGGRMSFLLDAVRFDLMWNHLRERFCPPGKEGLLVLRVEGAQPKLRSHDCAQRPAK